MDTRWSPLTKGIVIVSSLIASVWVLFRFSQLWSPLIVAIILAYLINLPVSWISRRTGWPRWPFVAVAFILLLLALVLVPVRVYPMLVALVRALNVNLEGWIAALEEQLVSQPLVVFNIEIATADLVERVTGALADLLSPFATGAISFAFGVATTLGWLLFILVIAYYAIRDSTRLASWAKERTPPAYQEELGRLGRELADIWKSFFRGNIIVGMIDGIVFAILLSIVGMPSALVLALVAGMFALIPSVGPLLAAIPAVLLALFQGSNYLPLSNFWFAALVATIYLVVFQVDSLYTVPKIVGDRLKLHPAIVIIGATGGAFLGGLLGVLLAAPVIASTRILAGYVYRKLFDLEPFGLPVVPIGETARQRALVAGRPVEAVLFDLDGTLVETDDSLVEHWAERLARIRRLLPSGDPHQTARWLATRTTAVANQLLNLLDRLGLDDETFSIINRLRRWQYQEPSSTTRFVSGAVQAVQALSSHYDMGVVTTRSREEADAFLQLAGLQECFAVVVTRDSTNRLKPHPQPVLEAALEMGVDVTHCAMVGDSSVDMSAAKAAGALAIGVLSGFGSRRHLRQADLILNSVVELDKLLRASDDAN